MITGLPHLGGWRDKSQIPGAADQSARLVTEWTGGL
jgi:hypothetical protein